MKRQALVDFRHFIVATRDSGYKNTSAALAELVDNSIESGATIIEINIEKVSGEVTEQLELTITDNGKGMDEHELNLALQFGGSSRFNSRTSLGRYGMGLPNSSLSQCRKVEITTWKMKGEYLFNYLDVDEIAEKNIDRLPSIIKGIDSNSSFSSNSGTIIRWKKCDRLSYKYIRSLIKQIKVDLGKVFRYSLWRGIEISVCGELVEPFDPLFMGKGINLVGGITYGKEINYQIKIPEYENRTSLVKVKFVELPVKDWSKLSNEEKRKNRITKNAGVSILRAEREIDYGWFFMGEKRKENYDDWWRCEISFNPELDEVFGVTHTKQEIRQTEFMNNILIPEIEQIARTLNNRVRLQFMDLKKVHPTIYSKQQLEKNDVYQLPLNRVEIKTSTKVSSNRIRGFQYEIVAKELKNDIFFEVESIKDAIVLNVNTAHLFYDKVFKPLHEKKIPNSASIVKIIELLIFAAARSEFAFNDEYESKIITDFKKAWSANLKTFIS
jgi:hypothetical protein